MAPSAPVLHSPWLSGTGVIGSIFYTTFCPDQKGINKLKRKFKLENAQKYRYDDKKVVRPFKFLTIL